MIIFYQSSNEQPTKQTNKQNKTKTKTKTQNVTCKNNNINKIENTSQRLPLK